MRPLRWAILALLALASPLLAAEEPFDRSDSLFQASERQSQKVLDQPEARKGWVRTLQNVRFGTFTLEIQQTLDPETDFPAQGWGDTDIRAYGPGGNWWFPPTFGVSVRLQGDEKNLLSGTTNVPVWMGLLECWTLRQVDNRQIIAEGDWRDPAGGWLRMRIVGWRDVTDRWGLIWRYFPPPGREADLLSCTFRCDPGGYTQAFPRQRWLTTPLRSFEVPAVSQKAQPEPLDVAQEWAVLLHSRLARQTAAGAVVADPENLASAVVSQNWAGTISPTFTAQSPAKDFCFLVGDWGHESYTITAARLFASLETLRQELKRLGSLTVPPPAPPPEAEDAEIADLLTYPALEKQFGEEWRANRQELIEALAAKEDIPAAFVRWYQVNQKRQELMLAMKTEWVKQKFWTQG